MIHRPPALGVAVDGGCAILATRATPRRVFRIGRPVLREGRSPFRLPNKSGPPNTLLGGAVDVVRDFEGACDTWRVYRPGRPVFLNGRSPCWPSARSEPSTTRIGRRGRWRMRDFGGPVAPNRYTASAAPISKTADRHCRHPLRPCPRPPALGGAVDAGCAIFGPLRSPAGIPHRPPRFLKRPFAISVTRQ